MVRPMRFPQAHKKNILCATQKIVFLTVRRLYYINLKTKPFLSKNHSGLAAYDSKNLNTIKT